MRTATWKILKRGDVPQFARSIEFMCVKCGHEALLPVVGLALAQVNMTLVFDRGRYAMPLLIECRHCRRRFESDCQTVMSNAVKESQIGRPK